MSIQEFVFLIVIFVANIFETMTGFAGTLLAMPASMMLIGLYQAKATLNIISLLICIVIVSTNYKYINKKELLKILIFMFSGMAVGMFFFEELSVEYLLNIYAIIIIAISAKNLFIKKEFKKIPSYMYIIIVLSAGIIHGMFLSGGSLLVIYAITFLKNKSEFRATLAAVWVFLDSILLINQLILGYVDLNVLTLSLYAFIPLFLAVMLGNYLHHYIKQELFYKLTYILLLISGITLLI